MSSSASANQSKNSDNSESKQDFRGATGKISLLSNLIERSRDKEAIWGVLGLIAGGLGALQIAKGDLVTAISAGVAMFAGILVWQESRPSVMGKRKKQPLTAKLLKGVSVVAFIIVLFLLIVKLSLKLFPSTAKDAGFQTISDFLHHPFSLLSPGTVTVETNTTETTTDSQVYISVKNIGQEAGVSFVTFTVGVAGDTTQSYEKKNVGDSFSVSGYEIRVIEIEPVWEKASFHVSRVSLPPGTQPTKK